MRLSLLGLLAVGVIWTLAGCIKDPLVTRPAEEYDFAGYYFLTEISTTSDGVHFSTFAEPMVSGVMMVYEIKYIRDFHFLDARIQEEGQALSDGLRITLIPDDKPEERLRGIYDLDNEWIKISYTHGDLLFTETWKRVTPVELSES